MAEVEPVVSSTPVTTPTVATTSVPVATPTTAPVVTTTTPVVTTTAPAPSTTIVSTTTTTTTQTWLQKHERIIITALVLTPTFIFGDHWINKTATKDKQQAQIAMAQVNEETAKDALISQKVDQLSSKYDATIQAITAQNTQIARATATRTVTLNSQEVTDSAMPMSALGDRWAQIAKIAPADITNTPTGVEVTATGAHQTVAQLEKVPVLQADVAAAQQTASNDLSETTQADAVIASQKTQIATLNTTVTDEVSSCNAQIKSVKASERKGKSNWFKIGFVGGIVVGFLVGHKF